MKKFLLFTLMLVATSAMFAQTTVWNPAGNAPSDGLWKTAANWTAGLPVEASKVVFNVNDAMACTVDSVVLIKDFVQGDGGPGDTLIIANGGSLTTTGGWMGVGYNNTATIIVNTGGSITTAGHLWMGMKAGAAANIHLNGGTISVGKMFGMSFDGLGTKDTLFMKGGLLNLAQLHPTQSIADGCKIVISGGLIQVVGDKVNDINTYIAANKISGASQVLFDSVTNVTSIYPPAAATTYWSPKNGTPALFTDWMNWSDYHAPDSNNVIFNQAGNCLLDTTATIKQLRIGDGVDADTLTIANGGHLTCIKNPDGWSGIGNASKGTLVVKEGGTVDFISHLYLALREGGNGTLIVDGGTVNIADNFGFRRNGAGAIYLNKGVITARYTDANKWNFKDILMDIDEGTLIVGGDRRAIFRSAIDSAVITAYGGTGTVDLQLVGGKTVLRGIPANKAATTKWEPIAGISTDLWTDRFNWSDNFAPDSNKVVFARGGNCVLNDSVYITQMVMGDGGDSDTLKITAGGYLKTSATWTGVGYSKHATMSVDTGGVVTLGNHFWISHRAGGNGNVIINGGYLRVGQMLGMDWDSKGNQGRIEVKSGILDLFQVHETRSIGANCLIDITGGTVKIDGDNVTKVAPYISANKIVAYGGTGTLDVIFDVATNQTIITAVAVTNAATTVWNPAANAASTGLWSEAANWTDGFVPKDNKVVFNVEGAANCTLNTTNSISRLVTADNGPGGTLTLAAGANLVISDTDWSAIGWTHEGTLIVDSAATITFGHHMWIGFNAGSKGIVEINGGTINVSKMIGLGWDGGIGLVSVNSGLLNLAEFNPSQSIGAGSVLDISEGKVTIVGDQSAGVNAYVAAGKITGFGGTGYVVVEVVEGVTTITATMEKPSAVKNFNGEEMVKVFYNSRNDVVIIKNAISVENVEIFNVSGQRLVSVKANGLESQEISTSSLNSGVYVVRMKLNSNRMRTIKFVK